MATAAQIEANRRNATKSTGPKTPEGKAKSAQNATKHGLTAQHIVLSTEDQQVYEAHRQQMLAELAPSGHTETMLAERIISLSWRLDRAARIQTEALDAILTNKDLASDDLALGRAAIWDYRNDRILDRLVLYERRIENSLHKSLRELNRLQTQRRSAGARERHSLPNPQNKPNFPQLHSTSNRFSINTYDTHGHSTDLHNKPKETAPFSAAPAAVDKQTELALLLGHLRT